MNEPYGHEGSIKLVHKSDNGTCEEIRDTLKDQSDIKSGDFIDGHGLWGKTGRERAPMVLFILEPTHRHFENFVIYLASNVLSDLLSNDGKDGLLDDA